MASVIEKYEEVNKFNNLISRLRTYLELPNATIEDIANAISNMSFSIDTALDDSSVIEGGIGNIIVGDETFRDIVRDSIITDNINFTRDKMYLAPSAYQNSFIIYLKGGIYNHDADISSCFANCGFLTQVGSVNDYFVIDVAYLKAQNLFSYCAGLKKAYIATDRLPANIFSYCSNLEEVYIHGGTFISAVYTTPFPSLGISKIKVIEGVGSIQYISRYLEKIRMLDGATINCVNENRHVYNFMTEEESLKQIVEHLNPDNNPEYATIKFGLWGTFPEYLRIYLDRVIKEKGWRNLS